MSGLQVSDGTSWKEAEEMTNDVTPFSTETLLIDTVHTQISQR